MWPVFIFLFLVSSFAHALRGDVTGDGIVDGKDALKILLVLEGRVQAPPQGDPFWSAADVHPLPGTEGRMIGDGRVTTDDAYKLLSSIVGLIPRGEITGDFSGSPPQIDALEPTQGIAGSRIILIGRNFVTGCTEENIVLFGDAPAKVIQCTGVQMTVEVPENAQTGLIRLLTPGGQAISPVEFTVLHLRSYQLIPPPGSQVREYQRVVNYFGNTTQPEADGQFRIPGQLEGVNLPVVLPKDGSERILVGFDVPSTSGQLANPSPVSLLTTAQALVYLSPYFATRNFERTQLYLPYIQNAPEVTAFAQVLEELYQQKVQLSGDPRFAEAYKRAIKAIIERLPDTLFIQLEDSSGTSAPASAPIELSAKIASETQTYSVELSPEGSNTSMVRLSYPDQVLTYADPQAMSVEPKSVAGNPVDWFVECARIRDIYDTFPYGEQSVTQAHAMQRFPRADTVEFSFIGSDSYLKYIDLFGTLFNLAWSVMTEAVVMVFPGLKGAASSDMRFHFDRNLEGVYEVRALSGALSSGIHAGEFDFVWEQLENGRRNFFIALGLNVALAGIDFSSMFINVKEIVGGEGHGRFRKVLRTAIRKGIKLATKKFPKGVTGVSGSELGTALLAMAYAIAQDIASVVAADMAEEYLKSRLNILARLSAKSIDPLYKISMGSQSMERITSLLGVNRSVTPLETWFVIVGKPFTPMVTSITPTDIGPGDQITFQGRHFDFREKLNNDVRIGNIRQQATRLRVLSVNAEGTVLVLQIPENQPQGEFPIYIKTPYSGGGVLQSQKLTIKRVPILEAITPPMGFAPSARAGEDPFHQYPGTILHLQGRRMQPSQGSPTDTVKINGISAPILSATQTEIQARVPALPPGNYEVFIISSEHSAETKRLSFTVLGPPSATGITPTKARPGQLLILTGKNFGTLSTEVAVHVGGVPAEIISIQNTQIECRMPIVGSSGETLPVVVYTPAGKSAILKITRLAGVDAPPPLRYDPGYQIKVTDSASGIQPNGQLSLDEAFAIARGDIINPFAPPWDDRDEKYIVHFYEKKVLVGTEEDGKPIYEYKWQEDPPIGPEYLPIHTGLEKQYYYGYWHDHIDHGGKVRGPALFKTVELDEKPQDLEEGDFVSLLEQATTGGASRADEIYGFASMMRASNPDLGDCDRLYIMEDKTLILSQPLTLHNSSRVELGKVENPNGDAILIKGHWNIISRGVIHAPKGRGLVIDGGFQNQIQALTINSPTAHGIHIVNSGLNEIGKAYNKLTITNAGKHGIFIENGEKNLIKRVVIQNPGIQAIHIQNGQGNKVTEVTMEGGEYGCVLQSSMWNGVWDVTIRKARKAGLLIQAGHDNSIESFQSSENGTHGVEIVDSLLNTITGGVFFGNGGDGVLLRGKETRLNKLRDCYFGFTLVWSTLGQTKPNQGSGLHLQSGAHANEIYGGWCYGNQRYGVLVEGTGTNENLLSSLQIGVVTYEEGQPEEVVQKAGNALDGIRITEGAQLNQIIGARIGFSGGHGVTIQGVGTEKNVITQCEIGFAPQPTDAYDSYILGPNQGAGILITDGALRNEIRQNVLGQNLGGGIRLNKLIKPPERDFEYTAIVSDCWVGYYTDSNYKKQQIPNTRGNGIHIEDTSHTLLRGNWITAHEIGLFIGGQNAVSHTVEDGHITHSAQQGMLVQDSQGNTITVSVEKTTGSGIQIERTSDTILLDCVVYGSGSDGIHLRQSVGLTLQSAIKNQGAFPSFRSTNNQGSGLLIEGSKEILLDFCQLAYNQKHGAWVMKDSQSIEIAAVDASYNDATGLFLNEVRDVRIYPTKTNALFIADNAKGVAIHNGRNVQIGWPSKLNSNDFIDNIMGNASQGVLITGEQTDGVYIIGINLLGQNGSEGVRIEGGKNIHIGAIRSHEGNYIGMNPVGVLVQGANSETHIVGNVIGEQEAWQTGSREEGNFVGIQLQGEVGGVKIIGNLINANQTAGILLQDGAHHALITRNVIQNNGTAGIKVSGVNTRFNQITFNTITDNLGKGIELAKGNDQVEAPVIHHIGWGKATVVGKVQAPKGSRVEIFADLNDEGKQFLGTSNVYGDTFYVTVDVPYGLNLHGVVIHPDGNTSEFGPAIPTEGPRKFTFTSTRDANPEVYLIQPGNPNPIRLTQHQSPDYSPCLSPDGQWILFTSERAGNPDIWCMRDNRTQLTQLTQDPAAEYDPAWSPKGDQFAFVSEHNGNSEIHVMPFTPGRRLGELGYDDGEADWSMERYEKDVMMGAHFTTQATTLEQILFYIYDKPDEFKWVILDWAGSQPGTKILAEGRTTPTGSGWHTVSVGPLQVPTDFVVAMQYLNSLASPMLGMDGDAPIDSRTWLYYAEWNKIDWGDLMIRAKFQVTLPNLTQHPAADRHPTWSPDGKRIAFTSERSGNPDVWLMNADGSHLQQLTVHAAADYQPAWSPDGTKIAFVSERDGNPEIYWIEVSGSNLTRITQYAGIDTDPAWTLDGKSLLFTSDRKGGLEIHLIKIEGQGSRRLTTSLGENTQPDPGISKLKQQQMISPYLTQK